MFYIGSRVANRVPPEKDVKYWGSSNVVTPLVKSPPNNFVKIILKTFDSPEEALQHEIELHEKYDVARNPFFYNECKATSTGFSTTGIKFSEEHRAKLSAAKAGRKNGPPSMETRSKISKANRGKARSVEARAKISATLSGVPRSAETRLKIAEASRKRWELERQRKMVQM